MEDTSNKQSKLKSCAPYYPIKHAIGCSINDNQVETPLWYKLWDELKLFCKHIYKHNVTAADWPIGYEGTGTNKRYFQLFAVRIL